MTLKTQHPGVMAALEIRDGALTPCTRPVPKAGADEILIRVAAAGVNRADLLQRRGLYPPPAGVTDIPGLEVAGWTMEPDEAPRPICALLSGGGYADYVCAPRALCLPVPKGLSMHEAAGVPEAAFTVWNALVEVGCLPRGGSVLIHGGASGIGTLAVQVAAALGARVVATAGGAQKCAAVAELGASRVVDYKGTESTPADFVAACREITKGQGVDLVVDLAGGDWLAHNLEALAPGGRHVSVAWMRGRMAEIPVSTIMKKSLTLTGFTLRDRDAGEKAALAAAVRTHLWPMIESGRVRPVVHAVYPLAEAYKAHESLARGDGIGKRILTVHPDAT